MISESVTFCPSPWTTLNIDQTGRVMPCMNSGYELGNLKNSTIQQILQAQPLRDLRQSIAQGIWHSACALCKQSEESSGSSGRTVRTVDHEILASINKDINWFGLEHIAVNWSNLCNLTCVYCNPETSTAWQSIKKIPINHIKNEHADLIELAQEHGHTVQGLTLGGGEPLLQKGLVEFLQCLDKEKVKVLVTTNLSVNLDTNAVYQELKTWPNVTWMVSFDNVDADKFEYVRDRASWTQFESNIAQMKTDQQRVVAHPAYSIYCAFDLVEYYEYCEQHDLNIFWCELTHPWDLDIRRYPLAVRLQASAVIDQVVARWGTKQKAIDTLLRYQQTLLDNSYLPEPNYTVNGERWHRKIETQLNKTKTFSQMWPQLISKAS